MDPLQVISHILSTLTIFSCLFLKVPQIMYIRQKQSAEGINMNAMLMEIVSYTIVICYNYTNSYNVMTYLEYPIILVQIYVLLYYVLLYNNQLSCPEVPVATGLYAMLFISFATQLLPKYLLSIVLPFCTPLNGFAKVTYIYGMVRARNADAVSLSTWVISVLTNASRLFTVYIDSADKTLMMNFTVSACLSTGVLLTAAYFQAQSTDPNTKNNLIVSAMRKICFLKTDKTEAKKM